MNQSTLDKDASARMPWLDFDELDHHLADFGRQKIRESRLLNDGQIGMFAAIQTFPAFGEDMLSAVQHGHFGETELPRYYKEMLATLVSTRNRCQY